MQARIVGSAAAIVRDVRVRLPKIQEKASVAAANRATQKVRTETVRAAARRSGVQQKVFRSRIRQFRYSRASGRARVWAGVRTVPLRRVYRGSRASTAASKHAELVAKSLAGRSPREAFVARIGGREGFFVRQPGAARFPVSELKLDLGEVIRESLDGSRRRFSDDVFQKEYERQLKRRLRRA